MTQMTKLLVILSIEVLNVWNVTMLDSELWVVMCFSAFCTIQDLDTQYFKYLQSDIKDRLLDKYKCKLPIEEQYHSSGAPYPDIDLNTPQKHQKILTFTQKC